MERPRQERAPDPDSVTREHRTDRELQEESPWMVFGLGLAGLAGLAGRGGGEEAAEGAASIHP